MAKLAVIKCTSRVRPNSANKPAPLGPCVPKEWDSSTNKAQPNSLLILTSSASGAIVPKVL
ncbi:Uncharacterised protein [Vibrio cholerae]|nr:Uncharacterised protein [Vibrio cholerae]